MSKMISARIPDALYSQASIQLASLGASTSDLVNAAFEYVLEEHALPTAHPSKNKQKKRALSKDQKQLIKNMFKNCMLDLDIPDDIKADKDLLKKFDVVINVGDADTAQSGGENWIDETIITAVREFVYNGGGFIGVGEPAAHQWQGRFIQLDDVLGVEEEHGFNLNTDKYNWEEHRDHFILKDAEGEVDFGEGKKNIYALPETEILIQKDQEVQMAVKTFGKGRGVYISGLPYSFRNSRVLYRAVLWSASAEDELNRWYSTNYNVEVHAYVKNGKYCVVNNTYESQDTVVYKGDGSSFPLHMDANEIKWYQI